MKYQWRLLVLSFCGLLFASCAQVEVDVTGTISGVVKDNDTYQVIENCHVTVSPTGKSGFTDASGQYTFQELVAGSYTLVFKRNGYRDQTAHVEVLAGQTTQKDIFLKPGSGSDPSEGEDNSGNSEDPNPEDPNPEDPNPEDPNPEEETPPQEKVFAGGSGAAYDPYQINSREQMQKMKDYASSHFKLVADIDMNGIQWIPVKLTGGFDGDDHTLYNLTISPYVATDNQGLFSELAYGASVKNLTIDGFSVNAPNRSYIGAIAGKASSSSVISNCHVVLKKASAVVGDSYIGGIAGEVYEMADCSVSSSVSSPVIAGNSIVGGAAGNFTNDRSSAKIERVTVSCNIYGDGYVGGIVGRHKSYGTLTECAYKGTISTGNNSSYIGGIIGYSECTVLACKADAKISVSSGSRYVGGIVGYRIMILAACYSTGEITGVTPTLRNYIGAISGDVSGSKCVHCYSTLNLKMDGSAKTSETGTDSYTVASLMADYGTNINLAEIMRATNSSYASYWNYDKTWQWTGIVNGQAVTAICPKLSWEK